jgi:hypothetical protein
MERPASSKQLAYIERLSGESKAAIKKPLEDLTAQEVSLIIEQLLGKGHGRTTNKSNNSWSNGARIGLAFKVCYQQWVANSVNIFANRDQFVKHVVDTYQLLNEIAEKAEAA